MKRAAGNRDRHSCMFNKSNPAAAVSTGAAVRPPPGLQVRVANRHNVWRLPPFDASLISPPLSVLGSPSSAWRRRSSEPLTFLCTMCQSWPPPSDSTSSPPPPPPSISPSHCVNSARWAPGGQYGDCEVGASEGSSSNLLEGEAGSAEVHQRADPSVTPSALVFRFQFGEGRAGQRRRL